jgi:hypothetical protein
MKNDKHVEGKMAIFGGMFLGVGGKILPQNNIPQKKRPNLKKNVSFLSFSSRNYFVA